MVRVNAKALIGFDFDKVKLEIYNVDKVIKITEFPPPEILSIDHNLDYYDISQGTFNKFKAEDYNDINASAKNYVRKLAEQGDLMQSAVDQKEELIATMRLLLEGMGWQLVIEEKEYLG